MLHHITFLLAVACAYSASVPSTAAIVNVNCHTFLTYGCTIVESLNIHEPTTLNVIEGDKWSHVLFLRFTSDSNITVFPSGLFQQFPKLTDLAISTGLKSIAKDDLKGADDLYELYIAYNQIPTLPANVFEYAKNLTQIFAYDTKLITIEDYAFNGLNKLVTLSLHSNSLTVLKRNTFAGAPNIKELMLKYNQIESIEDGALDLPELNDIVLSYNRIESIGEGTLNLPKLEYILLTHNRIKSLADNVFSGMPHLKLIGIDGNGLHHIGKAFQNCNELIFLSLNENPIDDLDFNAITKLPALLRLLLKDTGLRLGVADAHEQHDKESQIFELDIANNGLASTDVLARLQRFKNLMTLQLEGNNFSELNGFETIKKDFPVLEDISLTQNKFNCDTLKSIVDSIEAQKVVVSGTGDSVGDVKNYKNLTCV